MTNRFLRAAALMAMAAAFPAWAQQPPANVPTTRPPVPAAPAPAAPADEFRLTGFRSANFGMTADQVRAAIRRDFNVPVERIETVENPIERTTVLTVTVPDLLPNAGPALVAYVIGFRSRQLVQVTITWGGQINPQFRAEQALGAARQLQGYFAGLGHRPDSVATNAQQRDGSILVYAGDDAQRRRTLLVLSNVVGPEGRPPEGAPVLQLSYIRDPQNPDVFQIRRGDF
ncbi:MAG: hypothetical protein ACKO1J_00820 [Tagaea sp.]